MSKAQQNFNFFLLIGKQTLQTNSPEGFLIFGQSVDTCGKRWPGPCLTTKFIGNEALIFSVCLFLWYKYFHHSWLEATNVRSIASQNAWKFIKMHENLTICSYGPGWADSRTPVCVYLTEIYTHTHTHIYANMLPYIVHTKRTLKYNS